MCQPPHTRRNTGFETKAIGDQCCVGFMLERTGDGVVSGLLSLLSLLRGTKGALQRDLRLSRLYTGRDALPDPGLRPAMLRD